MSNSRKPIQAVKLPDLSTATDEEIDALAERLWEQFMAANGK